MIIGDRIAFTAMPKTASTWSQEVLRRAGAGSIDETRRMHRRGRIAYNSHARWCDIPPDLLEGRTLVTTVRRSAAWRRSYEAHFGVRVSDIEGAVGKVHLPHWPHRVMSTDIAGDLWTWGWDQYAAAADVRLQVGPNLRHLMARLLRDHDYDGSAAYDTPDLNVGG